MELADYDSHIIGQGLPITAGLYWEEPGSHEVKDLDGNFNPWGTAGTSDSAPPRFRLDVGGGRPAG